MCEPTTLAIASIASSVVGGGLQMMGQMQQTKAANGQAQFQAAVARNNQIVAERQATDALQRGELAEKQHRLQVGKLIGRQRTVQAANGVLVDDGSALDTTAETAELGEFDALMIRSNSEREAYSHRVQASNFASDATLADSRSRQGSGLGLLAGGLSMVGGVADKWYGFNKAGVKGF